MSPTRVNVAKSWPTLRVVATQKSPQHTQFISITTDKYKPAQTYGYLSYHRAFVFELKQHSRNYRHVGNPPTCRVVLDTLADTTSSLVGNMTETCRDMSPTRHRMSPFGQQNRHADIRHVELRVSAQPSLRIGHPSSGDCPRRSQSAVGNRTLRLCLIYSTSNST